MSNSSQGRWLVTAIIVATLTLDLAVILLSVSMQGTGRLPQQIVRFLLTIGLCAGLYQGANWARWVAAILFGLGGIGGLASSISLVGTGDFGALLLLMMALVYLTSAAFLLFDSSVRAHFQLESGY